MAVFRHDPKLSDDVYNDYALVLGHCIHAWNKVQEELVLIFATVADLDHHKAAAIWFAPNSDRVRIEMLVKLTSVSKSIADNAKDKNLLDKLEKLLGRLTKAINQRNDAVHGPCTVVASDRRYEIMPSYFFGNPIAERLKKRDIRQWLKQLCKDAHTIDKELRSWYALYQKDFSAQVIERAINAQ
jgi:hypothetical protein